MATDGAGASSGKGTGITAFASELEFQCADDLHAAVFLRSLHAAEHEPLYEAHRNAMKHLLVKTAYIHEGLRISATEPSLPLLLQSVEACLLLSNQPDLLPGRSLERLGADRAHDADLPPPPDRLLILPLLHASLLLHTASGGGTEP